MVRRQVLCSEGVSGVGSNGTGWRRSMQFSDSYPVPSESNTSSSSIDWSRSVWPQTFAFKGGGGKQQTPHRRERPHIVTDPKTKRVTGLTNSLQLSGADITQTLVQEASSGTTAS